MTVSAYPSTSTDIRLLTMQVMGERWRKYQREVKRCKHAFEEESVHDLRVATRRLIAMLEMVMVIAPAVRLKKARRRLKDMFDELSPLRDVQIQILSVNDLAVTYHGLEGLQRLLEMRERRMMKRLGKLVRKAPLAQLSACISHARRCVQKGPAGSDGVMAAVVTAAGEAFSKAVVKYHELDPADSSTIHALRVAFKKFRYKMEVVQTLFPVLREDRNKSMNAYQVRMGNIQDIEVLIATVNAYAKRKKSQDAESFEPVRLELARRRSMLIEGFLAASDELFLFWKDPRGNGGVFGVAKPETSDMKMPVHRIRQ